MPAGFPQMSQGNGSQSHGPPGTDGSSRQCARLKKVQIGLGAVAPVHHKKRVSKGVADRHEQMPKSKIPSISNKTAMASLQEFRLIYSSFKFLFQDQPTYRPDDYEALWVFRNRYSVKNYDGRRLVGRVPGVKVGDVFDSDAELHLTGLHRSQDSHVDYIVSKQEGRTKTYQAVSVVSAYGQHSHDDSNNLDHLLLHVGSVAGQLGGIEELALKQTSTSVRVIYRFVADHQAGGSQELTTCYVYAGLYLVERKDHGVDTFQLTRVPGQPRIDIQELTKERIAQPSSNGTFMADMSSGLEQFPVSAINLVSNEHPTSFLYISRIRYHHDPSDRPDPPSGCDCVGRCSESQDCACAVKNGGRIPFGDHGGIIEEKPLLYECGPSCKCPSTCHNRASQHRIKFRLQVFKTELMGWGVRSLDFIPGGSFVCEYLGELLDNEDAQKRENDEYLFVTGDNYFDVPRWEESRKTIPSLQNRRGGDEAKVFAVDALECGNLARFINHSCNPNLFTQNVLYDHQDIRMPHIMLFACGDIRPLQPLSLDYNYSIGKVHDSQGNIKKKKCFCRSSGCKGRLY